MIERGNKWGVAHAQKGPDVVGSFRIDGCGFVPVGMMEQLDSAGGRDEHGHTIGDGDEVVVASLCAGQGREDEGIFCRELVVILAG